MKVAKLLRKDLFQKYHYDGSLREDQYDELPTSVSSIKMILVGIRGEITIDDNQEIIFIQTKYVFISQCVSYLLVPNLPFHFASKVCVPHLQVLHTWWSSTLSSEGGNKPNQQYKLWHRITWIERDWFILVSWTAHLHKTHRRDLIDSLHAHGLSVSYDRVLIFSADEGLVCPAILRDELFTNGKLDIWHMTIMV